MNSKHIRVAGTTVAVALSLGTAALAQTQTQTQPARPAATPTPAPAAVAPRPAGATMPFAVVDVQQVLRDSTARKGIEQQIEKQRQALQAEFAKQEDALRASSQDLQRQQSQLTPEQFTAKRQEFERKVAAMQTQVQTRRRALEKSADDAMQQIFGSVNQIANDVSAERNVQMVISKAAVVSYDRSFDITAEVLRRLNAKLPAVNLVVPKG